MAKYLLSTAAAAALLWGSAASASTLNVLWYSGGVVDNTGIGNYQTEVGLLAAPGAGDPNPTNWNVTFWDSGPMPTGTFNVLVVASPQGSWATYPNYSALTGLTPASFGNRIMLTGQDADWHYTNSPGAALFDNPRGFLRDSINWAGNGTGMGLVALGSTGLDGCGEGGANFGFTGFTAACDSTNAVVIPGAYTSFPINEGLTSAGLSNWDTSAHIEFSGLDSSMWTGINVDGGIPNQYVTIVSAGTASGGTGAPPIPEPGTVFILGAGLLSLFWFARGKQRSSV